MLCMYLEPVILDIVLRREISTAIWTQQLQHRADLHWNTSSCGLSSKILSWHGVPLIWRHPRPSRWQGDVGCRCWTGLRVDAVPTGLSWAVMRVCVQLKRRSGPAPARWWQSCIGCWRNHAAKVAVASWWQGRLGCRCWACLGILACPNSSKTSITCPSHPLCSTRWQAWTLLRSAWRQANSG